MCSSDLADGQVRNCLFAREESDLRGALRAGAGDAEIAERWQAAMLTKRPATASTIRASCNRPGRCPRSADDGHTGPIRKCTFSLADIHSVNGSTSRRNDRRARKSDRLSLCSSQASQVLRRSGVWIFGLFHRTAQVAGLPQPLAEQTAGAASSLMRWRHSSAFLMSQ